MADPSFVLDPQQSVFVPAVLSLGILISGLTLFRDVLHRLRGRRWLERQASAYGHKTALLVRSSELVARADRSARRSRAVYGAVGVVSLGLATYLLLGSYGNYIGWTGWVKTISWIWLGYLLCIAAFAGLGIACLVVAVRWTAPPTWTHPLLAHTPLSLAELGPPPPARLRLRPRASEPSARRPLGRDQIDAQVASVLRTIASLWAMVAVIVLSLLAFQDRIPQAPDPGILESAVSGPLQIGLLLLVTIGSILCVRSEPVGAAIMAAAGSGLALIAGVQYPTWIAVSVAIIFAVPAFLHWLAWQRDRHLHHLVALATVTALLIVGVAVGADALSDSVLGPTHPESTVAGPAPSEVEWIWAGGTTSRSTTVVAKVLDPSRPAPLALTDARTSAPVATVEGERVTDEIVRYRVDGLEPGRRYGYTVGAGSATGGPDGHVTTFPEGAASFQIAFGSCSRTGSSGSVFDEVRAGDPLLYIGNGDLNYANVRGDDVPRFLRAYDRTLGAPAQAALYRSTSTAYVWDDHDYGGNDADRLSASRPAAQHSYGLVVPHHPLAAPAGDGAIYQSFTIGRIRVVLTDLRSHRDPADAPEPGKTMMGDVQLAWFESQLRDAAGSDQVVLWVSSSPWIDAAVPGSDSWGGYAEERRTVSGLIRELDLGDRLLMLGGDGHMVAFDDGSHSAYDGEGSGFALAHGGALDRPGGVKGGPYTVGPFPGSGQFGTLDVDDDGGPLVRVTVTGRTWDGRTLLERTVDLRAEP